MENSEEQKQLYESITEWINSKKRDLGRGLELMKAAGYKPHVIKVIENRGAGDLRSLRALSIELRNYLRENRQTVSKEAAETPAPAESFVNNIEKELQKEYPGIIKKTLVEFQSLYQKRSILHRELKAIGDSNDENSVSDRQGKLITINVCSRRMDILWGIFEKYKADGSLPDESFFAEPFDPEKEIATGLADSEKEVTSESVSGFMELPIFDTIEDLKKLKENLRIKISKAENRLEYQSEKKEDNPNPMPEGPKRAGLVKKIEAWKKLKEAVEYKIVELK